MSIKHFKFKFPVGKMYRMFKISKCECYDRLHRSPSKSLLENGSIALAIHDIFKNSFWSYVASKAKAKISKSVISSLKVEGGRGNEGQHYWVSDMTYIRISTGLMYLMVTKDIFHRKVLEWSIVKTLGTAEIKIPTWKISPKLNKITNRFIFHSDRGSQYAGCEFANILKGYNGLVIQTLSRKGNCWYNSVEESFFKGLKAEWANHQNHKFRSTAKLVLIDGDLVNWRRIYSTLYYLTIKEFEED